MSTIAEILDRLSGVSVLKERLADTSRNVDRSLVWLLDHEKRLTVLETIGRKSPGPAPEAPTLPRPNRK